MAVLAEAAGSAWLVAAHLTGMTQTLIAPAPARAPLTAADRCTQCGAQAYALFEKPDLVLATGVAALLFCAHHLRDHKDALLAKGFVLALDETVLLAPTNRQQGDDHA